MASNTLQLSANFVPGHGHQPDCVMLVATDRSKVLHEAGHSVRIDTVPFTIDHPTTRMRVWDAISRKAEELGASIDPKSEATYRPKHMETSSAGPGNRL